MKQEEFWSFLWIWFSEQQLSLHFVSNNNNKKKKAENVIKYSRIRCEDPNVVNRK